jgi:transcriptional regulator with XRE-family HTH domain
MTEHEASLASPERPSTYAAVVGARLRAVRRQKRLSLQAVEAASSQEFKASVLGAYERGERAISVPRLQRLARLYDVPVDQLLPDDVPVPTESRAAPNGGRPARGGSVRINLTALRDAPGEQAMALRRFLSAIQVERQDFNGEVLTIRADDLRVIGATFGLGTQDMLASLDKLGVVQHG